MRHRDNAPAGLFGNPGFYFALTTRFRSSNNSRSTLRSGARADVVDGFNQEIDQPVGHGASAQVGERGQYRQPQRHGVSAQFIRRFNRPTLMIALDFVRVDAIEQIGGKCEVSDDGKFCHLGLQAIDAWPARTGAQAHQRRWRVSISLIAARDVLTVARRFEQVIESCTHGGWQPFDDPGTEPVIEGMDCRPDASLDAIRGGWLDLE